MGAPFCFARGFAPCCARRRVGGAAPKPPGYFWQEERMRKCVKIKVFSAGGGRRGKINGIGGVFFRAHDPEALAAWYHSHLGVDPVEPVPWKQTEGYTVFAPFPADTEYFGEKAQQWVINFRVDDMDAMIPQLQVADIAVEMRAEWGREIGRFARLHDPEGNPIELWEPEVGAQ